MLYTKNVLENSKEWDMQYCEWMQKDVSSFHNFYPSKD